MNKNHIIGAFILGIFTAAFIYQVYVNYQFQKEGQVFSAAYQSDHATLGDVVKFLNSATQKQVANPVPVGK